MSIKLILLFIIISYSFFVVNSKSELEEDFIKRYVERYEPNYKWTLNATYQIGDHEIYVLELTSQNWNLPMKNVIWKHWLEICKPINYRSKNNNLLLFIDGDKPFMNEWRVPKVTELNIFGLMLCQSLKDEIVATVSQVPNKLIVEDTVTDNKGINRTVYRTEGYPLGYTMRRFFETNNPEWFSLIPQTKAVVKAMDAIQEFGKTKTGNYNINGFFITGLSKRGWINWFLAAIDKRIVAIAPMILPIINIGEGMNKVYQSYGNWSFALDDFIKRGIDTFLYTDYFKRVTDLFDPINYLSEITVPTFMFIATGDEFLTPDSTRSFYKDLNDNNRLIVVPNSDHISMENVFIARKLSNFFRLVSDKKEIPYIEWKIYYSQDGNKGTIDLNIISGTPTKIQLWSATTISKTKRDFRMFTCYSLMCYQLILWKPMDIKITTTNHYSFSLEKPVDGRWKGFFIQVDFSDNASFTTELAIVPDKYPFDKCPKKVCGSGTFIS